MAIRVLRGEEGSQQPPRPWHIAAAWLTETGLSHQPGKQSLASCVLYLAS